MSKNYRQNSGNVQKHERRQETERNLFLDCTKLTCDIHRRPILFASSMRRESSLVTTGRLHSCSVWSYPFCIFRTVICCKQITYLPTPIYTVMVPCEFEDRCTGSYGPLARYAKLRVRMRRECRERFPRHRG